MAGSANSGGLGIASFLKHTSDSGGGKEWLRQWKKNSVGEVTIWLHTRAPIVPCYSHQFMIEDEYEDKDTRRMVPVLRYPRFVSPDAEIVHRNQYFRENDDTMQTPPDLDPFLLLREWLRFQADHIGLQDPVFKWNDEKNRKVIVWERGSLSGLVKTGKTNFNHSLNTKLEYIYVVVDNDNVATGPVLAREGKLVSQKIVEVIKQQQRQYGEVEGDPMQHPYAFQIIAEDTPSPMNSIKAYKHEVAEFTDEVWAQISSEDYPDPLVYGSPSEGDMEKIRDAFEKAAQVELPLDEIFSEDPEVRRALTRPASDRRSPARASKAAQARGQTPPPPTRPAAPAPAGKPAPASAPAAAAPVASGGPQTRRKKVDKSAEPPPVEMIPCEDCNTPMLPTDTVCSKCGAQYEPVEDDSPPPPAPAAAPKPATAPKPGSSPKPATAPKPAATSAKPAAAARAPQQQQPPQQEGSAAASNCWSCGVDLEGKTVCPSCKMDQGDDIPF
jgi:hypothetical protein